MHPRVDDHPTPTAACPVGMELLYKALLPSVFCVSRVALVLSEPSPPPPAPALFQSRVCRKIWFRFVAQNATTPPYAYSTNSKAYAPPSYRIGLWLSPYLDSWCLYLPPARNWAAPESSCFRPTFIRLNLGSDLQLFTPVRQYERFGNRALSGAKRWARLLNRLLKRALVHKSDVRGKSVRSTLDGASGHLASRMWFPGSVKVHAEYRNAGSHSLIK